MCVEIAQTCPAEEIDNCCERPVKTFLISQLESRARSRKPRATSAEERTARALPPDRAICFEPKCSCVSIFAFSFHPRRVHGAALWPGQSVRPPWLPFQPARRVPTCELQRAASEADANPSAAVPAARLRFPRACHAFAKSAGSRGPVRLPVLRLVLPPGC